MRVYKEITETRQKWDHTLCDICKQNIDDVAEIVDMKFEADSIATEPVNECQVTVVRQTRISIKSERGRRFKFEAGGSTVNYEIDLCLECFDQKLLPWIKSLGVEVEGRDVYW